MINRPPIIGPMTPPVPITLPWAPKPFPLSASENTEVTIAIPVACVIAAPKPWNTRKIIIKIIGLETFAHVASQGEEPASKAMEPKRITPNKKTLLRPTMSESLPIGSNIALIVNDSASTTHWIVVKDILKVWAIVGSAIPTLPWCITLEIDPRPTAENTSHL